MQEIDWGKCLWRIKWGGEKHETAGRAVRPKVQGTPVQKGKGGHREEESHSVVLSLGWWES